MLKSRGQYYPKKFKTRANAIREHCVECMGGRGQGENVFQMVRDCNDNRCALWDFRSGPSPYDPRTKS